MSPKHLTHAQRQKARRRLSDGDGIVVDFTRLLAASVEVNEPDDEGRRSTDRGVGGGGDEDGGGGAMIKTSAATTAVLDLIDSGGGGGNSAPDTKPLKADTKHGEVPDEKAVYLKQYASIQSRGEEEKSTRRDVIHSSEGITACLRYQGDDDGANVNNNNNDKDVRTDHVDTSKSVSL